MMKRLISIIFLISTVASFSATLNCGEQKGDIAAVITTLLGKIYYQHADEEEWTQASKGQFLYEGDLLKSGPGSKAAVTFVNGIEVKMNENSMFKIETSQPSEKGKGNTVSMKTGQLWSRTMRKDSQFDIKTPAATVAIRGSTFDAKASSKFTSIKCYDGHGYIENRYGKTNLRKGEKTSAAVGKPPAPAASMSDADVESWQREVEAKGSLNIQKEDSGAPKPGESFKIQISVENESGDTAEDFAGIINLSSNNRYMNFSGDDKNWKERMYFRLRNGRGLVYAKAQNAGVYIINVETSDYTPSFLRVGVVSERSFDASAEEKTLHLQIEAEDGKKSLLELKFKP